jgi:hypothetical protein
MKFFNTHLSVAQIADAIDGRLGKGEIQMHLTGCSHCTKEYALLEKTIGLMRRDDSIDAPQAAFTFATNLFRTRKQFVAKESVAQKIAAILKLDLSALSPAFGERSAAAAGERQMLFSAGEFDIDLRIHDTSGSFKLNGQILGDISGNATTKLVKGDFETEAKISESGEFSFSEVPAGTYDLSLQLADAEIVISGLVIE